MPSSWILARRIHCDRCWGLNFLRDSNIDGSLAGGLIVLTAHFLSIQQLTAPAVSSPIGAPSKFLARNDHKEFFSVLYLDERSYHIPDPRDLA
jgi:hypothetical protein